MWEEGGVANAIGKNRILFSCLDSCMYFNRCTFMCMKKFKINLTPTKIPYWCPLREWRDRDE